MDFSRVLQKFPRRTVTGVFYRVVPEAAVPYALEDGPSYRFYNRYNVAGEFGALYFADREEICRALLEKRGLIGNRLTPHVLLSFEVEVESILDATDPKLWTALKISLEDLIKPAEIPHAYTIPQELSLAAYHQDRLSGLLTPDVTRIGNTLVLYPAKILTKDTLRLKSKQPLS